MKQDIDGWAARGLIDAATAGVLRDDVASAERRSISFGMILAVLAGLMLAAAILIFVAANWDAIPRLARVAGLFLIIFAGYVGGAFLKTSGRHEFAEAAWVAAAGAFGASIALTGQMYHLSGDEAGAILVWCLGTGLAAALLLSRPLTIGAVVLALAWLFSGSAGIGGAAPVPPGFLPLAAALWGVSLLTGSRTSRDILLLSVILYFTLLASRWEPALVGTLMALVGAALFVVVWRWPEASVRMMKVGDNLPAHCLTACLIGLGIVQVDTLDKGSFVLPAALGLAVSAAALVMAGRQSRKLRRIAYLGFALETALVYTVTVGSMLGTAGFFLSAALLLGLFAVIILRVERRMTGIQPIQTGAV